MNKVRENIPLSFIMLSLLFLLTACTGTSPAELTNPSQNHLPLDQDVAQQRETEETNVKEQKSKTLIFYYADEDLLTIRAKEGTITYFEEEEVWSAIWKKLQVPEEESYISLWADVELIGVEVVGSQLNIDIALSDKLQFGSTAEGFALQTLLQTVGQLEGIETLQLLINGQIEETLAGHVSIDQPLPIDEDIITVN